MKKEQELKENSALRLKLSSNNKKKAKETKLWFKILERNSKNFKKRLRPMN